MTAEHPNLVEQALGNLVKQFANPLDCLRELVQNSIDAGTPRIEIELRYVPKSDDRGVVEIEVADFGQGMDAAIIDTQLTRLFSSAKEGDMGAIGKFGIGFTSVFAIEPALVRVLTGRHGENWEILFHEDRSFERREYDGPVQGTSITLYKRIRERAVPELVRNARATLIRWCEHAETPIMFADRTGQRDDPTGEVPAEDAGADPFAAFATEVVVETLNRPFAIEDCDLQIRHAEGEVEVAIGYVESPSWNFFSGGLTLLRSEDPGHLGRYHATVGHLAFKVRSRRIEHTLTRDNVIQDEAWYDAMDVVERAAAKLREALEERLVAEAAAGNDLSVWHAHLARDVVHRPLAWDKPVFVDFGGRVRSLSDVAPLGPFGREAWYVHADAEALGQALWNQGLKVLRFTEGTRLLLQTALDGYRVDDAARAFVISKPVDLDALPDAERTMLRSAASHLGVATGNGVKLAVCEIAGTDGAERTLFLEGQAREGLLRKPAREGVWGRARRAFVAMAGLMMMQRWVVVNRNHPHVRRLVGVAAEDAELAGFALAQAILVLEQMSGEDAFDALASRAARPWRTGG